MKNHNLFNCSEEVRYIFIIDSRKSWEILKPSFEIESDIVLTYDFGLYNQINQLGGNVFYVDHLCEQSYMQENNFRIYDFFRKWHLDSENSDIFSYHGVDFGFSFRIEIWNDFTFFIRNLLCLEKLREVKYKNIFIDSSLHILQEILNELKIDFIILEKSSHEIKNYENYYFPVQQWMIERLSNKNFRQVIRDIFVIVQATFLSKVDSIKAYFFKKKPRISLFIQEYYPTRKILQHLRKQSGIYVLQAHFSSSPNLSKFFTERLIPVFGILSKYQSDSDCLMDIFRSKRCAKLILSNNTDITNLIYRVIENKIIEVLPKSLRAIDCVNHHLDRHPIKLEILIANLGQLAMIVDSVAKKRNIPSYLIINGLLGTEYLDEGKYATMINCYSTSIKDHHFRGMHNVVCLGDPRMDEYAAAIPREINRDNPTITIGTSSFSNVDLNSYLAVEFEFLYEVLSVLKKLNNPNRKFRINIKVRSNGYKVQYERFTKEYFFGLVDFIVDEIPIQSLLSTTDLYISIYSQTLFEASCLGIPVIYHKNDREIMFPPFDANCELVTTQNMSELEKAVQDFLSGSDRYDSFLDKKIMEKYVGPLDGGNLQRNLDFIFDLVDR